MFRRAGFASDWFDVGALLLLRVDEASLRPSNIDHMGALGYTWKCHDKGSVMPRMKADGVSDLSGETRQYELKFAAFLCTRGCIVSHRVSKLKLYCQPHFKTVSVVASRPLIRNSVADMVNDATSTPFTSFRNSNHSRPSPQTLFFRPLSDLRKTIASVPSAPLRSYRMARTQAEIAMERPAARGVSSGRSAATSATMARRLWLIVSTLRGLCGV